MISQIIAERPLNMISILNKFKSFIKQVYPREWTQKINKKRDENNYFGAETSEKEVRQPTLKEQKED